jgi:RHS repeat-associated protein
MFDQTGAQTWSGELSIWGELRLDLGAAWDGPVRWPGQYEDAETGLYYNRYRYYDPEAGQYVSQDPIGLLGGDQPYSYVSDPLVEIDPYGLIKAPPSLPDVPGIYIIRNGSQSYVGSAGGGAEGMYSRVSDPDHKRAQELLGMDDTTVHYSRVHLGPDLPGLVDRRGEPMTSRAQREQILRHFEQIQMDREEREGQRLTNDRRAQQPHNRPTAIDRIRQRGTRGGVRRRRCT